MSYIKLHRSLLHHPLWTKERFTNGQAWVDLLLLAGYADREVMMGTMVVPVGQGEVVTSQVKLAKRWGWDRKTVSRFLSGLQRLSMVRIRSHKRTETGYTIISITNWPTYQCDGLSPLVGGSPSDAPSEGTSEYPSDPHPIPIVNKGKEKDYAREASRAGPQLRGKKRDKAPDPNVKALVDHYHATFTARFGSPPPINGLKSGAIAKKLLAGRTLDEAKWLVTEYFANPPDYYEDRNLYGLEHVLSAAPTLLARRAKMTEVES